MKTIKILKLGAAPVNKFKNKINSDYLNLFKEGRLLIKLNLKKRTKKLKRKTNQILVINTCLIGEFIASLPALIYFIDKSKTTVDLVVSPSVKTLAKCIKGVRKVFTAKSIYMRDIERTKENKQILDDYDFLLVMRLSEEAYSLLKRIRFENIRSSLKPFLGFGLHLARNLSNKRAIKQWSDVNFEIIGKGNIKKRNVDINDIFNFKKNDFERIKKLKYVKNAKNKKKIIIHTGSGWSIKFWDNKKWIELLKKINNMGKFQFIFIGGTKDEIKHFNIIKKGLDFDVHSAIKRLDLKETLLLIKDSNYFLGVDSGPRHIAHLIDLPSICLLGPGPRHFDPLGKKAIIIDKSNCRCTNFFCYRKKTCMDKISVDDVFKKFMKIYDKY